MNLAEGSRAAAMKAEGAGGASRLVAAGMDRLLQDESADSYRTAHRILTVLIVLLTLATLVLALGLMYSVRKGRTGDRFYAMSFDGKKMPMQSLATPSLNMTAMLSWVSMAATEIMTFGFNDINERLNTASKYFTDLGYQSFLEAARKSGLIVRIRKNQQMMTSIPTGTPLIIYEGFRNGKYVWDIKVPIVLTVRAGSASQSAWPALYITVVRVPTRDNPNGMGIEQFNLF